MTEIPTDSSGKPTIVPEEEGITRLVPVRENPTKQEVAHANIVDSAAKAGQMTKDEAIHSLHVMASTNTAIDNVQAMAQHEKQIEIDSGATVPVLKEPPINPLTAPTVRHEPINPIDAPKKN